MDKQGQQIFFGIGMFIILFITIVALIGPFKDQVVDARGGTGLNCTDPSATVGVEAACILIDWSLFYWVMAAMAVGISFITLKRKFSE